MLERMWRKRNILPLLVRLQAVTTTLEINLEIPQKIGIVIIEDPAILLLNIYPKYAAPYHSDTCFTMFIEVYPVIVMN